MLYRILQKYSKGKNSRRLLPHCCGGNRALDWNNGIQRRGRENVRNHLKITLSELCLKIECREANRKKKTQASDLNPWRSWEADRTGLEGEAGEAMRLRIDFWNAPKPDRSGLQNE